MTIRSSYQSAAFLAAALLSNESTEASFVSHGPNPRGGSFIHGHLVQTSTTSATRSSSAFSSSPFGKNNAFRPRIPVQNSDKNPSAFCSVSSPSILICGSTSLTRMGMVASRPATSDMPDASFEDLNGGKKESIDRSYLKQSPLFDGPNYFDSDDDSDKFDPTQSARSNYGIFEDIESDYDDLFQPNDKPNGDDQYYDPYATTSSTLADDEDRILTEREDRLFQYINNTQKIESCILIGVEDLSQSRKTNKQIRLINNRNNNVHHLNDDFTTDGTTPLSPEAWNLGFTLEESMTEMRELIKTAGLSLRGEITQRLQEVNPKTYIGTGKVKEAQKLLEESDCCTVVFDAELTPGQQKALENAFNKKVIDNDFLGSDREDVIKVVDRTALILDIFAQHAKTREGKLQVDLALHEYRKPRLTRMWTHLERQSGSGGVGLRGPGETQLEVDKRILRDRILVLKEKIDDVQKQRDLHRRGRKKGGLPVLALVGYTNAGKSTLLNCLTRAGILAENILFATLDPTTRRVKLPGYKTHPEVLLTDTVGFIQKLPTQLVAAFRATLEEVKEADVLVHIVDVSHPCWRKQEASVMKVLNEIGAGEKPIVRVFNKIDLLEREEAEMLKYEAACSEDLSVGISSLTGEGLSDFVAVVEDALSGLLVPVEMELPYTCGQEINLIHEVGSIETIDYRETGTYILGRVPRSLAMKLEQYQISPSSSIKQGVKGNRRRTDDGIDLVALGKGRHQKNVA